MCRESAQAAIRFRFNVLELMIVCYILDRTVFVRERGCDCYVKNSFYGDEICTSLTYLFSVILTYLICVGVIIVLNL